MTLHAVAVAVPVTAAACLCAPAGAAISLFTEANLYDTAAVGLDRASETFAGYVDGTYPSPLAGSAGPVSWTATASQGLLISSGRLSAAGGQELVISFQAGAIGILGVSGNFFPTSGATVTEAIITVELNDGTTQVQLIDNPGAFMGFLSSSATITSIRIAASGVAGPANATVDNLSFSFVPAPAGIAVLAIALARTPRRRRA